MLLTLFYFALTLLLLVTVHEFGHFWVARLCGVKVLRFSFGFGKVLASWHDKRGTEYAFSLFPLGGYVKMLDEAEGEVALNERHLAFNNQSLLVRIAIVLGGPLFNFLFAFLALWLVLVIGIQSLAPMIDTVKPGSIAAHAGFEKQQEIVSLNGRSIASWRDFQYAFMPLLGTHEPVTVTVKSVLNGEEKRLILPLKHWELNKNNPDLLESLGLLPFVPSIPPIVGEVFPDSPAQAAGLHVGDRILSVNQQSIEDWLLLVSTVKNNPDKRLKLGIVRDGLRETLWVQTSSIDANGHKEGMLGVRSKALDWPKRWLRLQRESPIPAMKTALVQTVELSGATFALVGRLVQGKLSLKHLSGPVGIAEGAGASGRSGLPYYLSFLALVSISLGVLNLLPVPLLDGGHLLYYLIEAIRRRPLSIAAKSFGLYVGLLLLMVVTIIAVSNDLVRLRG